ncbi:MFS transporter [Nocardioides terrisoli]|uniref:MFS transporter n=1 Tax=Nocardioides terrisoli TaxID=3388267 RepID=UPI00287B93A3|nr:MFS transporter [Nocardioides marmorisolisilvae]
MEQPTADGLRRTTALLSVAVLGFAVQQTAVVPAIQDIERSLHAPPEWSAWLVTLYLVVATVATLALGRLADLHGRRRMLLVGMVVFAVASVGAAVAPSILVLLLCRALQGIGGAVYPLALSIARAHAPEGAATTAIALLTAAFGVGTAVGFVAGGLLSSYASWRWIFVLGAVLVGAGVLMLWRGLEETEGRATGRFDLIGTAVLALSTVGLLAALTLAAGAGWSSPEVVGLLVLSAGSAGGWIAMQRRAVDPLIDLHVLSNRSVAAANLATVAIGWSMFSAFLLVPRFARLTPEHSAYGLGADSAMVGLILLPIAVGQIVASLAAGRLIGRVGATVVLGTALLVLAAAGAVLAVDRTSVPLTLLGTLLLGLGAGSGLQSGSAVATEAVAPDVAGISASVNSTTRRLAGGVGGQVSVLVLTAFAAGSTLRPSGFTIAYLVGVGLCVVGVTVTVSVRLFARSTA